MREAPMAILTPNNFQRQHLPMFSRTEYRSWVVFVMSADSTRRVDRPHDFNKIPLLTLHQYWCVFGKVNCADTLYRAIESVKPDTKHAQSSSVPVPADGAGGGSIP